MQGSSCCLTVSIGAAVAGAGLAFAAPAAAVAVRPAAVSGRCPDGSRIRRSPNTTATVLGLCYSTHRAVIHCSVDGPGYIWGNVTDQTTGVFGWSAIANWGLGGVVPQC
jgi:hypothetical protein